MSTVDPVAPHPSRFFPRRAAAIEGHMLSPDLVAAFVETLDIGARRRGDADDADRAATRAALPEVGRRRPHRADGRRRRVVWVSSPARQAPRPAGAVTPW